MTGYILSIDQSTQGTKALLFDSKGTLVRREDIAHRQLINEKGWVSHDLNEIYSNTLQIVKRLMDATQIEQKQIIGVGISNQRETTAIWDRRTGLPLEDAIVWQCSRSNSVCERIKEAGEAQRIREKTGIPLSPYFPGSKLAWFLENRSHIREKAREGALCMGTVDSWLIYQLTKGASYKTDYSNASRTQLFHLQDLQWDPEICQIFGVSPEQLPEICDSDSLFGYTDFDGVLDTPIPIHGVLGDSHSALFGQGCFQAGMVKATYGTGSSIMMNVGSRPVFSNHGVVTSLAWKIGREIQYVLEGNINYTGAVISWLKNDLALIHSPQESEELAASACQDDHVYLIPAFTGLSAPYWNSKALASITGMGRTTGKAEIVRAGLESIAYQTADVIGAMRQESGLDIRELRVDGGPTRNQYLMQFQSDILGISVQVPEAEELSGMGVAYAAGMALGLYSREIHKQVKRRRYTAAMKENTRNKKYSGWMYAMRNVLSSAPR